MIQSVVKGLAVRNKFKTKVKEYHSAIDTIQNFKKTLKIKEAEEQWSDQTNVQCTICKGITGMCYSLFRDHEMQFQG